MRSIIREVGGPHVCVHFYRRVLPISIGRVRGGETTVEGWGHCGGARDALDCGLSRPSLEKEGGGSSDLSAAHFARLGRYSEPQTIANPFPS